jgi:hypothetical protein
VVENTRNRFAGVWIGPVSSTVLLGATLFSRIAAVVALLGVVAAVVALLGVVAAVVAVAVAVALLRVAVALLRVAVALLRVAVALLPVAVAVAVAIMLRVAAGVVAPQNGCETVGRRGTWVVSFGNCVHISRSGRSGLW